MPVAAGKDPVLASEFRFLRRLGKIPENAPWQNVESALAYTGLREVLSNRTHYRVTSFDYRD